MHNQTHTLMYIHTHSYTLTHSFLYIHTLTNTNTHTNTRTYIYAETYTHIPPQTLSHTHTLTCMHAAPACGSVCMGSPKATHLHSARQAHGEDAAVRSGGQSPQGSTPQVWAWRRARAPPARPGLGPPCSPGLALPWEVGGDGAATQSLGPPGRLGDGTLTRKPLHSCAGPHCRREAQAFVQPPSPNIPISLQIFPQRQILPHPEVPMIKGSRKATEGHKRGGVD